MKLFIYESQLLQKGYYFIHDNIPFFEKKYNIKIIKILGDESMGVAYLTDKKTVLKITPSGPEYVISKALIKNSHKNFPEIYSLDKFHKEWWIIHKEYVDLIDKNTRKKYKLLEREITEWDDLFSEDEIMAHKLINIDQSLFLEYLKDFYPDLIELYNQLNNIVNFAAPLVNNSAVDIHIDNLGEKNGNIILFDY